MKHFIILLLSVAVLFNTSCSKDDDAAKADLLSSTAWKSSAGFLATIEIPLEDCDLDNRFYFRSDGTYELNDGADKCFSSNPDEILGTWELREGDTKLNIDADGDSNTWDIIELNEGSLILEATVPLFGVIREEYKAAN